MKEKLFGILGGMGPQASCELYRLVNEKSIAHYDATRNADFPHMWVSNIPVPDLISDADAQEKTIAMVRDEAHRFARAGVTDLFMACNTMHLYADEMFHDVPCQFHSLIEIVAQELQARAPDNVLLLATKTTVKTNLYQAALDKRGVKYSCPSDDLLGQSVDMILDAISGDIDPVKREMFYSTIESEADKCGADLVLLACTELPLIVRGRVGQVQTLSSLDVLADLICRTRYAEIHPGDHQGYLGVA